MPASAPLPPEGRHGGEQAGGALWAIVATLGWSSSGLLIDRLSALYHLTALQLSAWRVVLVLPILVLALFVRPPGMPPLRVIPWLVAAGLAIVCSNLTWATSVQDNGPAVAAALAFSGPAFIAVGDRFLFHSPLGPLRAGAVLVNLAGCGLAAGLHDPGALLHLRLGLLIGIANGGAYAAYALLNSRTGRRRRSLDPRVSLLVIFLAASIGTIAWGLPLEGRHLVQLHLDRLGWILLVALAVGPTLLAYAAFNSALRHVSATVAGMITTLEPPIVAVGALLLFGQAVRVQQWIGIALIVGAVVTIQISARRTGKPTARTAGPE